jgi:hypothetical protein
MAYIAIQKQIKAYCSALRRTITRCVVLICADKKTSMCYDVCVSKTTTKRRNRADGREILTIAVRAEAMAEFDRFVAKYGGQGIKINASGRLFEWFVEQPEWMRQIILGWDARELNRTLADLLEKMANELRERPKLRGYGAAGTPDAGTSR